MGTVRSKLVLVVVGLIVGAVVAGGVTWAAIPHSSTGQITACYPKTGTNKVLRVIDAQAGQSCTSSENTLSWQAKGLRWKGAWSASTAYVTNDIVTFGRSAQAFVAVGNSTGVRPIDIGNKQWKTLAGGEGLTPSEIATLRWGADPNRSAVLAGADLNTDPIWNTRGIAFDGTSVWFVDDNNPDLEPDVAGEVIKVNPATNAMTAEVAVGNMPDGVAFDGKNLWVANSGDGSVTKINPATNAVVATVGGMSAPHRLAFDGTRLWVTDTALNRVHKINITTNTVTGSAVLDGAPAGIAWDGAYIWVAVMGSNKIEQIDPNTSTIVPGQHGGTETPVGVAFDGTRMWVTYPNEGKVVAFNADENSVDYNGSIDHFTLSSGSRPLGLAFDGHSMWVTDQRGCYPASPASIGSKIDVTTSSVTDLRFGTFGYGPSCGYDAAFDGANVWMTGQIEGLASVFKFR